MGGEIQITDDLTLTAHWTANTYTVQYKGQSSYSFLPDTTYSTQLCTYDVPFTMPGRPQNAFVAGKTFAGWSYTRGASTPDFLPEQEDVVNLTDEDEGVVELWAVWRSSWPGGGGRFGMQSSAADPEPAVAFHTKTYTYDLAGNRTYFELSKDGETIQSVGYAYDTLNRLTAVTENGVTQASYTYDINGNRSGMTLTNGVSTAYTYNAANWITSLTNSQNGNTLSSFDYTYYPSGNQASKTDQNGVVTTYQYDGLGRLTCESEQGGLTVNYAFDAAGNRASMAVTGTENYVVNYNYDANNRLISSLYTGGTTQSSYYTYDACGNLLTAAEWRPQEAVASTANYGYNGFNQLATQTVNDVTASFAYNASGIRTAKLTGNVLTGYLLDGGNVVAELEDDELSTSYLRGANLISRTTSTTEYYTFNAHGDVVGLVSAAGTQTKTYDYDAFGNEKDRVGSDPNPFRYCGEYFDVESGAYYLRARYYDPSVGRFTQEDTHWNTSNMIYGDEPQQIGEYEDPLGTSRYTYAPQVTAVMQAGNLYGYCIENPVYYNDVSGCLINTCLGAFSGAIGGAITAIFHGKSAKNGAIAGAIGGAIAGFCLDIGLIVSAGTGGAGTIAGIGITAFGAALGAFTQNIVEQLLNGTELSDLDLKSAAISAGIGAGFSLISFGLGKMVGDAFELTPRGIDLLTKLWNSLADAGWADSLIAEFLSIVFVELDKAVIEGAFNK